MVNEHSKTDFFDDLALGQFGSMRRSYAVGGGLLLAAGIAIGMTRLGRGTLSTAVNDLAGVQPAWIVAAASMFGVGLLASAGAWRVGLRACGGTTGITQISARYAIGSLVNSVAPAHLGGAHRQVRHRPTAAAPTPLSPAHSALRSSSERQPNGKRDKNKCETEQFDRTGN